MADLAPLAPELLPVTQQARALARALGVEVALTELAIEEGAIAGEPEAGEVDGPREPCPTFRYEGMIYLLSPGIIDTFEGATIQTFNQWIGIRRAATQPLTEDDLYRSPLTGEATLADVLTWIHPAAAPKPDAAFFEAFEEDLSKWIGLRPGLHFNLPQRTPIYPEPPEHTSTH